MTDKNRGGRPPVPDSERLRHERSFRLADRDQATLVRLAAEWGCSEGEVLRRLLRREKAARDLPPP